MKANGFPADTFLLATNGSIFNRLYLNSIKNFDEPFFYKVEEDVLKIMKDTDNVALYGVNEAVSSYDDYICRIERYLAEDYWF